MDDVLTAPAPVPPVGMSSGPLGEVQAAVREIARQTAVQARAVAAFAASRPAAADRAQGEPGAMSAERWARRSAVLRPVSEWATQELAVALSLSAEAAQALLERSLTLVHRLPATLEALEAGVLHVGHVWPLLDRVAPIADDALRARLEADLLVWAAGRVTTPAQLGDKARREVLKHDARAAADRLARAVRERGVSARPDRVEGTSVVSALLTTPEAAALVAALGAYADALPADPDDIRTRGQRMADCLLDLVLRPGESDLPPVQVVLSVVAPLGALLGGDAPCEIDGQVVPAETVRALLAALTGHPLITPADTATADTAPTDTAPTSTAPTSTAPTSTAPTSTAPTSTAPTDTAPADTAPADTAPADTAPAGTAPADSRPAGSHDLGPIEVPVRPAVPVDPEFERWWTDTVHRVLTEELAGGQPPLVDAAELQARWAVDEEPPETGPPPQDGPLPDGASDRWWARADRAVDAAGDAVLAAQQALGRARRLVATAARADAADEAAWANSPAGRVTTAPDALTALAAATDHARAALTGLLAATGGGGLADRPRLVLTDALTGALLTLTDLPALRRAIAQGGGLGPPGRADGYRPGAALDRHVRTRDRRCRFPGCRRRVPRGSDLDHAVPWPTGPTTAANLAGYCTGHHRGKHQAPGWRHTLAPDGTLTVTTPTGLTAATTPPPY
ncbi:HNH endonuclease signature motif containing protein [Geodermatophilus normandii]|uniref:HNH endonuclease signature motif containing protein n=1 Tax=Geodermatophilus normandii TaxID=1137989 RepID=UPI001FE48638|nr:HNH endonuclease signature motif containing protein [Geodermatophilus normandii]